MKNLKNLKFITVEQLKKGDIIEYFLDYRKQILLVDSVIVKNNKAKIEGRNPITNQPVSLFISDIHQQEYFKIICKPNEEQMEK